MASVQGTGNGTSGQVIPDGTYAMSGAYFSVSDNITPVSPQAVDIHQNRTVTAAGKHLYFTDNKDPSGKYSPNFSYQWDYDYSWGDQGASIFILGNTSGSYHIVILGNLASQIDVSKVKIIYNGYGLPSGSSNYFTIILPDGQTYSTQQDAAGTAVSSAPCYLAGGLVSTPYGYVPVEEITPGRLVYIYQAGTLTTQRVSWVGKAYIRTAEGTAIEEAKYPVRIKENALRPGVPFKDMLITAEHCLYLENHFVPVRMLVNGSSITYDASFVDYEIYHFAVEGHAVVCVDGLLTESFLNTGNHCASFTQCGAQGDTRLPAQTWEDAVAPLGVAREIVEPLYERFLQRAEQNLGFRLPPELSLTSDPALALEYADGRRVLPEFHNEGVYVFQVPHPGEMLWLVSRIFRPCDVVGPYMDDRRRLGVLVGDISLQRGEDSLTLDAHLTQAALAGWDVMDDSRCRWTKGRAQITLPVEAEQEGVRVSIHILGGGPYRA